MLYIAIGLLVAVLFFIIFRLDRLEKAVKRLEDLVISTWLKPPKKRKKLKPKK